MSRPCSRSTSSILPGCSRHLVTMSSSGIFQHAHFGRHHDAVVAGDEVARRAQAVAVQRGADLAAVGEGDRGRAVPRLHDRGVIFVEGAALLVHQRVAGPGFRNHHHHRVRQRIAALHQEFEAVVEAGGVGLAFIGDRPQPRDVLAVQLRMHRGLPRRHPVDVAAQRVDLAVVRDHPVGMRQRPGREGVGGEALMHQRQRALEIGLVQIGIILAELVGKEHALVDHGAARHRHRIIAGEPAVAALIDRLRDRLAQDVEPALELVFGFRSAIAADEDLHVVRFGRLHGLAERCIVGRHVAPTKQHQPLVADLVGDDALDDIAPRGLARHEQRADGVLAGRRQLKADLRGLAYEEAVRNLHQDAGAVTGARIGADRAAVFEIAQNVDRIRDDLMRLPALDIGNEADAAGVLLLAYVVQAFRGRAPGMFAQRLPGTLLERFRERIRRQRIRHDVFAFELGPAHLKSSQPRKGLVSIGRRTLGVRGTPIQTLGPPLVLREPQFQNSGFGVQRPRRTALPANFLAPKRQLTLQSPCRIAAIIETVILS